MTPRPHPLVGIGNIEGGSRWCLKDDDRVVIEGGEGGDLFLEDVHPAVGASFFCHGVDAAVDAVVGIVFNIIAIRVLGRFDRAGYAGVMRAMYPSSMAKGFHFIRFRLRQGSFTVTMIVVVVAPHDFGRAVDGRRSSSSVASSFLHHWP